MDNNFLEKIISENSHNDLSIILDSLPFGISLQNKNRIILYENVKAEELTGNFKLDHCFNRWKYIKGEGCTICTDCPATISLIDREKHKIFRKTIDQNNEDLYLEIQVIPILEDDGSVNKYIEILFDVSNDEKVKSLVNNPISSIINNLEFSLSVYGKTGGEVLLKDDLHFFSNPNEYIQKISTFTYIGVFQNNFDQLGLFGPLPVLDVLSKCMIVYSFQLPSKNITDPRRHGMEACLFLTFFDREYYFVFEEREKILQFLNKSFENKKVEDLDNKWFLKMKKDFKKFLVSILNGFELKD